MGNLKQLFKIRFFLPGLLALVFAGTAYAAYSQSYEFENPFSTVDAQVTVHEKFNPSDHWLPGEEKEKNVTLENEGTQDMLLRFRISVEWSDGAGKPLKDNPYGEEAVTLHLGDDVSEEFWLAKDGWYYYRKVFKAGATTKEVLKSVTFNNMLSNDGHYGPDYSDTRCNVLVSGETVTAENTSAKKWNMNASINVDGSVTWNQ